MDGDGRRRRGHRRAFARAAAASLSPRCLVFLAHPHSSCWPQHGGRFFQEALSHPGPAPRMSPDTADMTACRTSIFLTRPGAPWGKSRARVVASPVPTPDSPGVAHIADLCQFPEGRTEAGKEWQAASTPPELRRSPSPWRQAPGGPPGPNRHTSRVPAPRGGDSVPSLRTWTGGEWGAHAPPARPGVVPSPECALRGGPRWPSAAGRARGPGEDDVPAPEGHRSAQGSGRGVVADGAPGLAGAARAAPALPFSTPPLLGSGAPFSAQWGSPGAVWSLRPRPVSEAWFPFAGSAFPQTAPHPPRPGASEGLSPTPSWQPPAGLSLCVPSFTPTSGTGIGAELAQAPKLCKYPRARAGVGWGGHSELPGRPWGLGPSTGSTSG